MVSAKVLGIIGRNGTERRVETECAQLQSLVRGALLDKVASLELLLTTARNLLVLCHRSTVASEAVNRRVDVAANRLANALDVLSDESFKTNEMRKTNVTLGKYALQALSSLSTLGAASGSCGGVCGCGVVDARGIGTREVVCRHGEGCVGMDVIEGIGCWWGKNICYSSARSLYSSFADNG